MGENGPHGRGVWHRHPGTLLVAISVLALVACGATADSVQEEQPSSLLRQDAQVEGEANPTGKAAPPEGPPLQRDAPPALRWLKLQEREFSPFEGALRRLSDVPDGRQPELGPETPIVELRIRFSSRGEVSSEVRGTGLTAGKALELLNSPAGRELSGSRLWALSTAGPRGPYRAVSVFDPRQVIVDRPVAPDSGALTGGVETVSEGVMAVYLPFFSRGAYGIFSHVPGQPFQKTALSVGQFGETPPPPGGQQKTP